MKAGEKYNNLTLIKRIRGHRWLMKCDCGNQYERTVTTHKALTHCRKCHTFETHAITHGDYKTRLNQCWRDMKYRCNTDKEQYAKYYKNKGITYAPEWEEFQAFKDWALANGYQDNLTLERKDSNKNYCPENCSWIPQSMQQKTSGNSKNITVDGITKNYADWGRYLNIHPKTIAYAINTKGWDPVDFIKYKLLAKKNA